MGQTNVYRERDIVFAIAHSGSTIKYGFKTAIDTAEQTALGQVVVQPNTTPSGIVFGAKFPRPAVWKKIQPTYTVTSFLSFGAEGLAQPAGYSKVKSAKALPLYPAIPTTGLSVLCRVQVAVNGANVSCAWRMPKWQYNLIQGDLPTLGIETILNTETDRKNTAFGLGKKGGEVGFPVPPRASKIVPGAKYTTYYSLGQNLPPGWLHTKDAIAIL